MSSNSSSEGLSTISKSTRSSRGTSVHWDKEVEEMENTQRGRRDKSDKEKIQSYLINYNLELVEIQRWLRDKTTEKEGYWNMTIKNLREKLPRKRWKRMVKDIRQNRVKKASDADNDMNFDDPHLETAIQNMSSFELMSPSTTEQKGPPQATEEARPGGSQEK